MSVDRTMSNLSYCLDKILTSFSHELERTQGTLFPIVKKALVIGCADSGSS